MVRKGSGSGSENGSGRECEEREQYLESVRAGVRQRRRSSEKVVLREGSDRVSKS